MAYPTPTKDFSQPSPYMAMFFAPFGCTHPPPPVWLSAKDIAMSDSYDVMHMKSHEICMHSWVKLIFMKFSGS